MTSSNTDIAASSENHGPDDRKSSVVGLVFVLLSAACFSLAGVLIKLIPWSALSVSAGRSFFAAITVYIYLRAQGRHLHVNKQIVIGTIINYGMVQCFVIANKLTTAANTIVLQFTEPLWVIVLAFLLFGEKPKRAAIVACVAVFAGVACFFLDKITPTGMAGNILAVVSGLLYAGVFLIKKWEGADFECIVIFSFLLCVLTGLPTLVGDIQMAFTPEIFAMVVVCGVVQSGLAFIFLSRGLDRVSPVTASITSTLEPILNPIFAALVLGETLGPLSLVGALLVVGAATVYSVYSARSVRTP